MARTAVPGITIEGGCSDAKKQRSRDTEGSCLQSVNYAQIGVRMTVMVMMMMWYAKVRMHAFDFISEKAEACTILTPNEDKNDQLPLPVDTSVHAIHIEPAGRSKHRRPEDMSG